MIKIENIEKTFGQEKVLRGLSLSVNEGERLAVIGKSGCGKSVLLKCILGLLLPEKGSVIVDGEDLTRLSEKELYPLRRRFGFLFQSAALFDSMNVYENISLPLVENKAKALSEGEIKFLVRESLDLVGLGAVEALKPAELSGGMKKRVGLARALITKPKYMLYDEPTTGLDPQMSDSIDDLLNTLGQRLGVTSILVTHDLFSVRNVASRIAMIHEGVIYFSGSVEKFASSDDEVIKNFISRTGFHG